MRVCPRPMRTIDDLKQIKKIDRSGMLVRAAALPAQCLEGWSIGLRWKVPAAYAKTKQLLVLGMGGSAIGADLVQGILGDDLPKPTVVSRGYTIPKWVGPETLVLVASYSGNTEETLSSAMAASKKGGKIIAITSGGKLADWCRSKRYPLTLIPQGLPPRSAVGYMTFIPLGLMVRLGWVSRASVPVEKACREAERFVKNSLGPKSKTVRNPAKQIALRLHGKIPELYGAAGGWEGIVYRWRTQIEENAKALAFHHMIPEATHNEVSAWMNPKPLMPKMAAVFLTDRDLHPRTRRRMQFTAGVVKKEKAAALFVEAPGSSRLARMIGLIAIGDFVSSYLGILYGIDPTPVERIEGLKKFMIKGG